jgi:hypothetical protein
VLPSSTSAIISDTSRSDIPAPMARRIASASRYPSGEEEGRVGGGRDGEVARRVKERGVVRREKRGGEVRRNEREKRGSGEEGEGRRVGKDESRM